jgi:hypothetical protein
MAGGSAGIDTVEVADSCNEVTSDSATVSVFLSNTTIPPTKTTTAP